MAIAGARRTAAALAALAAGVVLAACGPHGTGRTAPAASRASGSAAAAPAAPAGSSASPSGTSGSPSASAGPSSGSPAPLPPSASAGAQAPPADAPGPSGGTTAPGPSAVPGPGDGGPAGSGTSASIEYALPDRGAEVALTFDDGPDPRWTPQVLDLLAKHHARATFCEIGPNAQRYPYLVQEITAAGNRLCDHSVHHDEQQSSKSAAYNRSEIADARQEISDAAGPDGKLWYYRAPGGDFSPQIRAIAAGYGLRPLGWTVDSGDWRRPGPDAIMRNIGKDLRPGAIILMHDGGGDRSQTIEALARLLDLLDAQGYGYVFPAR